MGEKSKSHDCNGEVEREGGMRAGFMTALD